VTDVRRALEGEERRFELAPGALDRFFDRRRHKQRNQRIRAAAAAAVIATAGVGAAFLGLRDVGSSSEPATSPTVTPNRELYPEIAGTYVLTLDDEDPRVQQNELAGRYTMRLLPDGVVLLTAPPGFGREGASPSGISFRISGDRFTTNAFINFTCPGTVGVYRWELAGRRLTLTPLQEDCEVREILFSSRPWTVRS
jgi:hypothetical protein